MCATHTKIARREEKSNKKKEELIGAQLMAEINEPTDDTATVCTQEASAWRKQRHAFDDVQIHTAGAGSHTSAGGYGNEAARASSHLTLPQQPPAAPPVGAGAAAATSAAEDHKRALVNALQKDIYDLTLAQMADPPLIVRLIMRIADFP